MEGLGVIEEMSFQQWRREEKRAQVIGKHWGRRALKKVPENLPVGLFFGLGAVLPGLTRYYQVPRTTGSLPGPYRVKNRSKPVPNMRSGSRRGSRGGITARVKSRKTPTLKRAKLSHMNFVFDDLGLVGIATKSFTRSCRETS